MDNTKKIIISLGTVGDSMVGKSSIVNRYLEKTFEDEYFSTIGVNSGTKNIIMNINKKELPITIKIWDTAGQEQFKSISVQYIRNCFGMFIIYAINNKESFNNCISWLNEIEEKKCRDNTPIILIGNKIDLKDEREVSYEEGENFAKKYNLKFFECSAKEGININEAFKCIIDDVVELYKDEFFLGKKDIQLTNTNGKQNKCKC